MSGLEFAALGLAIPPLIQFFTELGKQMRELHKGYKNAPGEVKEIAHQATHFSDMLIQFEEMGQDRCQGWNSRRRRIAKRLMRGAHSVLKAFDGISQDVQILQNRHRTRVEGIAEKLGAWLEDVAAQWQWISKRKAVLYIMTNLAALRLSTAMFVHIEVLHAMRGSKELPPSVEQSLATIEVDLAANQEALKEIVNRIEQLYQSNQTLLQDTDLRDLARTFAPRKILAISESVLHLAHKEVRHLCNDKGQYIGRKESGKVPRRERAPATSPSTDPSFLTSDKTRSAVSSSPMTAPSTVPSSLSARSARRSAKVVAEIPPQSAAQQISASPSPLQPRVASVPPVSTPRPPSPAPSTNHSLYSCPSSKITDNGANRSTSHVSQSRNPQHSVSRITNTHPHLPSPTPSEPLHSPIETSSASDQAPTNPTGNADQPHSRAADTATYFYTSDGSKDYWAQGERGHEGSVYGRASGARGIFKCARCDYRCLVERVHDSDGRPGVRWRLLQSMGGTVTLECRGGRGGSFASLDV